MRYTSFVLLLLLFTAISILSCTTAPEPLKVGTDHCYFCKMTISDTRFGAEIVTQKGKVYKFDDVHCILSYLKTGDLPSESIKAIYLTNFSGDHQLISTPKTVLLKSEALRSPMGGNVAAFDNEDSLKIILQKFAGEMITWDEISKK